MKGTNPGVVLGSSLFEFDALADDADNVGLLLDRVREVTGVRHTSTL
jgi:hypothetical protein